jgi:hypothetical protein
MKTFEYDIGGKKYIQRPLVLGQIRQLMRAIEGVRIPQDIDTIGLISALGDKLPIAIAIVLTDETPLKDKNIDSLASQIEFEISPETTMQVVEDFFACNPIASLLERISGMANKISETIKVTGLEISSASSAEETLQKETQSCGALP